MGNKQGANEVGVFVGQIWADNDPRSTGRRLRVVAFDEGDPPTHILAERVGSRSRRQFRIAIKRLRPNSTGYYYVSGPTGDTP